jgi:hypothetical protein
MLSERCPRSRPTGRCSLTSGAGRPSASLWRSQLNAGTLVRRICWVASWACLTGTNRSRRSHVRGVEALSVDGRASLDRVVSSNGYKGVAPPRVNLSTKTLRYPIPSARGWRCPRSSSCTPTAKHVERGWKPMDRVRQVSGLALTSSTHWNRPVFRTIGCHSNTMIACYLWLNFEGKSVPVTFSMGGSCFR